MDLYDELPTSRLLDDPEYEQLLESSKINCVTVIDFLTLNSSELSKLLQRSLTEVTKFQFHLQREYDDYYKENGNPTSTEEADNPKSFTTGEVTIDEGLGGGIYTHGITEIFGESSTGKSQFLMQLSLTVQLPILQNGLNGKCVYITTEGDLATTRLEGIIESRSEFFSQGVSQKNIYTVSCNDLITQEHIINVQLPVLLQRSRGDIKLIILDSISHHLRVELETNSFKDSQDNRFYIDQMAERLLSYAKKYNLAVVVANQVGDKPLLERNDPIPQEVTDYDYQIGWIVGWKDSTILYRKKISENGAFMLSENNNKNSNNDDNGNAINDILSDDEDYHLIEQEISRIRSQNVSQDSRDNCGDINSSHDTSYSDITSSNAGNNSPSMQSTQTIKKRKKKGLDSRVPNLGISWANHLTTRILLRKSFKAAPMIQRGEVDLYKGYDPTSFWKVRRTLQVIFSSYAKPCEIPFSITKNGINSIE